MVFVDHATEIPEGMLMRPPPPSDAKVPPRLPSNAFNSQRRSAVAFGIESDANLSEFSVRDRDLRLWAMAQARNQKALQPNHEMMPKCVADAHAITREPSQAFGDKPLVDVTTVDGARATELRSFGPACPSLAARQAAVVWYFGCDAPPLGYPQVQID
jgi:hypothetical protein